MKLYRVGLSVLVLVACTSVVGQANAEVSTLCPEEISRMPAATPEATPAVPGGCNNLVNPTPQPQITAAPGTKEFRSACRGAGKLCKTLAKGEKTQVKLIGKLDKKIEKENDKQTKTWAKFNSCIDKKVQQLRDLAISSDQLVTACEANQDSDVYDNYRALRNRLDSETLWCEGNTNLPFCTGNWFECLQSVGQTALETIRARIGQAIQNWITIAVSECNPATASPTACNLYVPFFNDDGDQDDLWNCVYVNDRQVVNANGCSPECFGRVMTCADAVKERQRREAQARERACTQVNRVMVRMARLKNSFRTCNNRRNLSLQRSITKKNQLIGQRNGAVCSREQARRNKETGCGPYVNQCGGYIPPV